MLNKLLGLESEKAMHTLLKSTLKQKHDLIDLAKHHLCDGLKICDVIDKIKSEIISRPFVLSVALASPSRALQPLLAF